MKNNEDVLSKEWIDLVVAAMKSDITKEEFKEFLKSKTEKMKHEEF
ncbi:anti-repressor SinI family protein [Robertmurraya massiliosenegalensis]